MSCYYSIDGTFSCPNKNGTNSCSNINEHFENSSGCPSGTFIKNNMCQPEPDIVSTKYYDFNAKHKNNHPNKECLNTDYKK